MRDGFNLDLTYITNYVIALGYPAEGMEATIRNSRADVISFFKLKHGVNVKIYNLCIEKSKQYD
jgi:phosphatidylinositol-3,4,5-trisphosphate 3-phosphatase/dual-specificity protein phosphatase PTEN